MKPSEAWMIRYSPNPAKPVIVLGSLAAAMAWCVFDNYGDPIRWMVYNDRIMSAGPYSERTNRGYQITRIEW
jgi:hypothetical protein